jgi:23S rRNA (adenine2503-C2)-methyltransferase
MLPHLLDLDPDALMQLFAAWGEPRYRAQQVSRWLLQRGVTDFEAMTDLPAALRARLAAAYRVDTPSVLASTAADDGETTKVLLDLGGDASVETVRMRYDPDEPGERERATVCVSTQVGCAMRCVFCATGQQGFTRNLTPSEILAQVLHFARTERVTNVVFMGMGEPLANTHATLTAVRWLVSPDGMDLRARGVTVSTVGLRAGIRRLAEARLQIGLTISLHAPDDELRHHLIPTSAGTSIDDLVEAAREYIAATGRRVTFAYALLQGVNDSPEQARLLATRIRGIQAHVNLIPYNPTAGPGLRRPSRERVRAFQRALQEAGINATVRVERGVEIAAACGQLRTDYTERQRLALV